MLASDWSVRCGLLSITIQLEQKICSECTRSDTPSCLFTVTYTTYFWTITFKRVQEKGEKIKRERLLKKKWLFIDILTLSDHCFVTDIPSLYSEKKANPSINQVESDSLYLWFIAVGEKSRLRNIILPVSKCPTPSQGLVGAMNLHTHEHVSALFKDRVKVVLILRSLLTPMFFILNDSVAHTVSDLGVPKNKIWGI